MRCSRASIGSTTTTRTRCGSCSAAADSSTSIQAAVPCSSWKSKPAISFACRAACITGSTSAPTAAFARFDCFRIRRAGRRTTPRAAWIAAFSRCALARRTRPSACRRDMRLDAAGVRAIILDIEGTTTPASFVVDVLFPFARRRLRAFLDARLEADAAVHAAVDRLDEERGRETEAGAPPWPDRQQSTAARIDAAVAYADWL